MTDYAPSGVALIPSGEAQPYLPHDTPRVPRSVHAKFHAYIGTYIVRPWPSPFHNMIRLKLWALEEYTQTDRQTDKKPSYSNYID